jgi:NTE family protein
MKSALWSLTLILSFSSCSQMALKRGPIGTSGGNDTKTIPIPAPEGASGAPSEAGTPPAAGPSVIRKAPHFGIIFSAGGALAWGHVGVLREMQKYKFPVVAVGGLEWGAVAAAAYAQNLSANEAEWEMSKFKDIDEVPAFIKASFEKKTVADLKTSYVCPSVNLRSQILYLLNRGNLEQFLPFCLPSPGLVKPFGDSVSAMGSVASIVQHLRSNGAQRIILINLLAGPASTSPFVKPVTGAENQLWVAAKVAMKQKGIAVDEVIELNLSEFGIDDFQKRRDITQRAAEQATPQLKKIAEKYGL